MQSPELIEFPSRFPVKVVGPKVDSFVENIRSIAAEHDPSLDDSCVQLRDSAAGKYVSITLIVTATSREQLDNLYRAITSHPEVRFVL